MAKRGRLLAFVVALWAALAASVLALSFGSALPAQAQSTNTITVNSTQDNTTAGDGQCTLREAINNANSGSDTTQGDCTAGSGADTIDFDPSLTQSGDATITLTSVGDTSVGSSALLVQSKIKIAGPTGENGITIARSQASGTPDFRLFYVKDSTSKLALENLTVANGSASSGNGSGIYDGGGIRNEGTLTVTNSTFSNNSGYPVGGGIFNNEGTLTVTNSTFFNNSASFSVGGGIFNERGALTVTNSTFSNNSAPQGGSGIYTENGAAPTLSNTIVAKSTSGGNCSGTITDGGYNISDDRSCKFSKPNSMNNVPDPGLDPKGLQNNGGPTQTIALESGSPAIDAIPPNTNGCGTTITTDQRGVTRPQGSGCDIGAFELEQSSPPPPPLPPPPPPGHHHKHHHGGHHHKKHHGGNNSGGGGGGGGGVIQ